MNSWREAEWNRRRPRQVDENDGTTMKENFLNETWSDNGQKGQGQEHGSSSQRQGRKTVGKTTGDRQLETEGNVDQMNGNVKQAGEKVKDTFKG